MPNGLVEWCAEMSYKYGARSRRNLGQCDERIQLVMNEVIKQIDCAIICGHRNEEDQTAALHAGTTKLPWPESNHNELPSKAVDAVPWPVDWNNKQQFCYFAGIVMATAATMGIKLRWGGDWNMNNDPSDDGWDMPHFEIIEEE